MVATMMCSHDSQPGDGMLGHVSGDLYSELTVRTRTADHASHAVKTEQKSMHYMQSDHNHNYVCRCSEAVTVGYVSTSLSQNNTHTSA
jgi:hypothetical protein